jgi:parallel beta-helix repeat protein
MRGRLLGSTIGATLLAAVVVLPAGAREQHVIVVSGTIQAAVDAAAPGDTIVIPPGTYHESVQITTSGVTLQGSAGAVIDAAGFRNGIKIGVGALTRAPDGHLICPATTVHDVAVHGLTVENALRDGLLIIGVDGFAVDHGRYVNNDDYGIFPECSQHGVLDSNRAEGAADTGLYIGEDDSITLSKNEAANNTSGIEVENSTNVIVRDNKVRGNTAGISMFVLPGLPFAITDHVAVIGNLVVDNNLPNPIPVDSGDPEGLVPTGTGILDIGADDVTLQDNVVLRNNSLGIGIESNPFAAADARIDPTPDHTTVLDNVATENGHAPDPARAPTPGADIVYDGTGTANCFSHNHFKVDFPAGITKLFVCT